MNKKIGVFLLGVLLGTIRAMDLSQSLLNQLPNELQCKIIESVIKSQPFVRLVPRDLAAISTINKHFNDLIKINYDWNKRVFAKHFGVSVGVAKFFLQSHDNTDQSSIQSIKTSSINDKTCMILCALRQYTYPGSTEDRSFVLQKLQALIPCKLFIYDPQIHFAHVDQLSSFDTNIQIEHAQSRSIIEVNCCDDSCLQAKPSCWRLSYSRMFNTYFISCDKNS